MGELCKLLWSSEKPVWPRMGWDGIRGWRVELKEV